MKHTGFEYKVSVVLQFTALEAQHIQQCARDHYDGKCRLAAEQGGFVYGMVNAATVFGEQGVGMYTMDERTLDLLRKIMEPTTAFWSSAESSDVSHAIVRRLNEAWAELLAEYKRLEEAGFK